VARSRKPASTAAVHNREPAILAGIALAALALRLVLVTQLGSHPLLQPGFGLDTDLYVDLARRVAGGDLALGPGAFPAAPLYIYFLGGVLWLSDGSLLAARMVQAFAGAAAVWLMGDGARRVFGRGAGVPAAALAAICGPFAFNEVLILQSSLDPLLTALALWAIARALDREGARPWLVAGAASALFGLNRPNALLFLDAVVIGLVLFRRRAAIVPAAAFILGAALAIAPVTLRNLSVTGEFVLVSAHGGFNFYVGNNAEADGTYRSVAGITPSSVRQQADARAVAGKAVGRTLSDSEASSYFYGQAWHWIRSSPGDAARLWLRKLRYVFSVDEISLNYSYAYYRGDEATVLRAMAVGAWLLLPLGLAGLLLGARRGEYWLWAAFVPVYAASVAIFFVSERYRLPLLVPLAVAGGALLARWMTAIAAADWRRVVRDGTAVAVLAIVTGWPTGLDNGLSEERTAMAEALIRSGDVARGQTLATRALAEHPQPALLLFRVGRSLQARGDRTAAIARYQQALETDPARVEIRYFLGQCLLDEKRVAEAIPHLDAAVNAGIRADVAPFDLARALASTNEFIAARQALARLRIPAEADTGSYATAGQLAEALGDGVLAIRFYGQAAERADAPIPMLERLGVLLAMGGRPREAVTVLERALARQPSSPSLHLNLGVALAQDGRLGEARARVDEALRLRPEYPQARALAERLGR
jgi:Tfp pilus assembly protein PilF/4-amino-4-deoxy-L-arabinose transferase-like glycosyltransferase